MGALVVASRAPENARLDTFPAREKNRAVTRRRRRGRRRRSLFVYARACVISEGRLRVIGVHRRHRRRGVCAKRGAEDNDKFEGRRNKKDPIRGKRDKFEKKKKTKRQIREEKKDKFVKKKKRRGTGFGLG